MVADVSKLLPEIGIELMDIRIKRMKFVESFQQKVFDRMIFKYLKHDRQGKDR